MCIEKIFDTHQYVDRITKARAEAMFLVQDLYWQEFCKLRLSNTTPVCKVGGANGTKCDAINLGCLLQKFPDLEDPRTTKTQMHCSVNNLIFASLSITEVCSALIRRYGEHQPCAVGARLYSQSSALLTSIVGLDLDG